VLDRVSGPLVDRRVADFRRSLGGDLIATAGVYRPLARPVGKKVEFINSPFELVLALRLGVAYGPARRIAEAIGAPRMLGDTVVDLLAAVDPGELAELRLTSSRAVRVRTPGEARRVAGALAELATTHAPAVAGRFASVDALLADARGERARAGAGELAAAVLLAGAGRIDEARTELAAAEPGRDPRAGRRSDARRLHWRLTRWLDAQEGNGEPPPPAPAGVPVPPLGEAWREVRRLARARRAALRVVRRGARRKSREQLRAELTAELARRTPEREPLWVERSVDRLVASPAQRVAAQLRGAAELRALLRGVRQALLGDEAALEAPHWLDPPARAVFSGPAGPGAHKSLVVLDAAADGDLERVHRALVAADGEVRVRSWLAWEPEPARETSVLAVHVGPYRVGALDGPATAAMTRLMDSAATRGELPVVEGTLYRRAGGGFLLELPLATAPPAPR
jgi:hypothetical protein